MSSRQPSQKPRPTPLLRRVVQFWLGPEDALRTRLFECLFTLTFLIWMGRCFVTWEDWLTTEGFHLTKTELNSMGYPDPWPLFQPWQVPLFALLIFGSGTLLLLNKWRRFALIGLFAAALYAQRVDYMAAFTLNKLYVGCFALMVLAPGPRRDPLTGQWTQSVVLVRVLQCTLLLQYLAAGLAKVDGDWLKYDDVLWGHVQGVYRTEIAAWALRTLPKWTWTVQQHVALGFELLAPLLFMIRRLRPLAFIFGIGMHFIITVMMKDLFYFSLQMWTFYVLFITSTEWRQMGAWFMRKLRPGKTAGAAAAA